MKIDELVKEKRTYYVDFPLTVYVTEVIEADSAEQALEIAEKLLGTRFINELEERFEKAGICMDNLETPEVTSTSWMGYEEVTLTQSEIDKYMEH